MKPTYGTISQLKFGCYVASSAFGDIDSYRVLAHIGICKKHKFYSTCERNECYENDRIEEGLWLFFESEEAPFEFKVLYDKIVEIQCEENCEHRK